VCILWAYLHSRIPIFIFWEKKKILAFVNSWIYKFVGSSWSWSYGSWIYNYMCNRCLSLLTLWVRTPLWRGVLDTTLCDKVCQWLATCRWFSTGTPVSSTKKPDRHNVTAEILLKVALNTILITINSRKAGISYSHGRYFWSSIWPRVRIY